MLNLESNHRASLFLCGSIYIHRMQEGGEKSASTCWHLFAAASRTLLSWPFWVGGNYCPEISVSLPDGCLSVLGLAWMGGQGPLVLYLFSPCFPTSAHGERAWDMLAQCSLMSIPSLGI